MTGEISNKRGNDTHYTWLVRLDSMGCFAPGCYTDTLSEVLTTKTEEIVINITGSLVLYPNPSSDKINLSVPQNFEPTKYQIFDIIGNLIKEDKYNDKEIDISDLQKGLFFVRVIDRNNIFTDGKFIKN